MKDIALEQVWTRRKAISERCDYDSRKLVKYLQQRSNSRRTERDSPPNSPPQRSGE